MADLDTLALMNANLKKRSAYDTLQNLAILDPMKGQFQVGGPLQGNIGLLDKAFSGAQDFGRIMVEEYTPSVIRDRILEASKPTLQSDLMGGVSTQIQNPYSVAAELSKLADVAGGAGALTRFGAMKLGPPIASRVANVIDQRQIFADALRPAQELKETAKGYIDLKDSEGGRVLNTDTARELFPEYIADRTKSADVHEDASAIVKHLYADKLKQPAAPGELDEVLFTAGGTGAGKSTAIEALDLQFKPQIIYDTNISSFDSAKKKIEQAKRAGKQVRIVFIDRDPVEALVGGALPRAERQRLDPNIGTGRTVPLKEHYKTHKGSRDVIKQLSAEYHDDPMVSVLAIDNKHGKGGHKVTSLDKISEFADTDTSRLRKALDEEYEAGRISEETYKGFIVGE